MDAANGRVERISGQGGSASPSPGPQTPTKQTLLGRFTLQSRRRKRSSVIPMTATGATDSTTPVTANGGDGGGSGEGAQLESQGHRGSIPRIPHSDASSQRKKAGKIEDFVPELVVRYITSGNEAGTPVCPPAFDHFASVAMFADLSGFTVLSETLAVKGGLGAETLGFWLNRYFELLVQLVAKSGGDVFKFAGDALVALWPPEYTDEPSAGSPASPIHRSVTNATPKVAGASPKRTRSFFESALSPLGLCNPVGAEPGWLLPVRAFHEICSVHMTYVCDVDHGVLLWRC